MSITSLLTVGDTTTNGYQAVGVLDGLGALREGRFVTVLANHEIGEAGGVPRAHGRRGAFVSRFVLDPKSLEVHSGNDLATSVRYWRYDAAAYADTPSGAFPAALSRLCSATLASNAQLYNARTGRGYRGWLFVTGEENGLEGRVFAFRADGVVEQLPRLGLGSFENTSIATTGSDATVAISNPDERPAYLRIYRGSKTRTGSPADRAGLTNGALSVLVADGIADDGAFRDAIDKGEEVPVRFSGIDWNVSGAAQDDRARSLGALAFTRVEDGDFDPRHPNDYYFTTTEHPDGDRITQGALWRLRFTDVGRPERGAMLSYLLDGREDLDPVAVGVQGWHKPDNIDIDTRGNLVIQEDPGDADHVASVFAYQLSSGRIVRLAQFDPALFGVGSKTFVTRDEESSGIIDTAALLGPGTFVFDAQVHTSAGVSAEAVERGQLLLMKVDWSTAYANAIATRSTR